MGLVAAWLLSKQTARGPLWSVLKTACQPVLLVPFVGLAAMASLLAVLGQKLDAWEPVLIPATVAWVLFQGVPLMYRLGTRKPGEAFFRPTLARMLRLTWVVEVFIGFYVFNVFAELILLVIISMLAMISALSESREEYRQLKPYVDGVLGLIGIGLLLYVAVSVVVNWDDIDKTLAVRAFLLPVVLTVGVMPYLYVLSFWAGYHDAFIWINAEANDRASRRRAKLGLFLAFGFRASMAKGLRTYWARQITEAKNIKAARAAAREFLLDQRRREREKKDAADRLVRNAGVEGEDEDGQRLDQREFAETKKELQWLATMQMGWHRNRGGRYRPELLDLLRGDGLPENHGIHLNVAKNGQSWWAWRRTVTGWCFAIGAAEGPPDQWLYDGPDPPKGFPGQDPAWGDRWGVDAKNW